MSIEQRIDKYNKKVTEKEQLIIDYINKNNNITILEIADYRIHHKFSALKTT